MENILLNEGVYDFYILQDEKSKLPIPEKIVNYYLEKIKLYGKNSLTKAEMDIFNKANRGILDLDKPIYKRSKVTGDVEYDLSGNPIRILEDKPLPGVPFVTSKGKGMKKKEIIDGRCYWNIDEEHKYFYVYTSSKIDDNNLHGIMIWKTISSSGKPFGSFIVPKGNYLSSPPEEVWKDLNNKYDKGFILDKTMYEMFLEFNKLYRDQKPENMIKLNKIYSYLCNFPKK